MELLQIIKNIEPFLLIMNTLMAFVIFCVMAKKKKA